MAAGIEQRLVSKAVAEAVLEEEEHFDQQSCLNYWAEHCLKSKAVVEEALEHFDQQSCLNYLVEHCLKSKVVAEVVVVEEALDHFDQQSC